MIVTTGIFRQRPSSSWLQRFAKSRRSRDHDVRNGNGGEGSSTTRAIDFPNADRYTDDPQEEARVAIENPRVTNPEEHHTLFPSAHGNGRAGNEWVNDQ